MSSALSALSALKDELDPKDRTHRDYEEPLERTETNQPDVGGTGVGQKGGSRRRQLGRLDSNSNSSPSSWFKTTKSTSRAAQVRNAAIDVMSSELPKRRSVTAVSLQDDDFSISEDSESVQTAASSRSIQSFPSMQSRDSARSIVTALLGAAQIHVSCPETCTEVMVVSDLRLAVLCRVLSSTPRRDGIPKELEKGNDLARRMRALLTFPVDKAPNWLWGPLFEGLLKGPPAINALVHPPQGAQPMTILTWLCQYKSLQKLFCWKGHIDVIRLALAAGADPNIAMTNGSTPLFFAVKYGCLETVKLLVKYGADVTAKDKRGRTCLWNALERPMPEVICYLLKFLPATEDFPYHRLGQRATTYQTAVDYLFASQLSLSFDPINNPEYPWSWQVLGPPSEESVARCMIEFGKRGVTFSPSDVTLALLSFVLRGEEPNKRRNRYPYYPMAKKRLEHLALMMVGLWLPETIHQVTTIVETKESDDELTTSETDEQDGEWSAIGAQESDSVEEEYNNDEIQEHHDGWSSDDAEVERGVDCSRSEVKGVGLTETQPCHICNHKSDNPNQVQVKLYCGHDFCLECIEKRSNGTNLDLTCPVCHRQLCLDLTGSINRRWECLTELYGEHWEGHHGPKVLTPEQLRMECQARGITTVFRTAEKLRNVLNSQAKSDDQPRFDLNTNIPITDGLDMTLIAPSRGPIAIPIIVKGVPVTAYISVTSRFTLVAPEFVELFGLRRTDVMSNKLTDLFGMKVGEGTLIEEFPFTIGEINVCLTNAIEVPLPRAIGVQLGIDFLRSGSWCVIDTKLDGVINGSGPYVSTDGFGHTTYSNIGRKEELRYYAADGKVFRTYLMHLQPFREGSASNWRSIRQRESFVECSWCCRVFPSFHHEISGVYYCTAKCCEDAKEIRFSRLKKS